MVSEGLIARRFIKFSLLLLSSILLLSLATDSRAQSGLKKVRMHCHNADQTFYVIEGQCTMHFPDGGKSVMTPGMVATITGGSFYQLENSGSGPMVLMGNRSGPSEAIQHINYELRKDIKTLSREEMEKIRDRGNVRVSN